MTHIHLLPEVGGSELLESGSGGDWRHDCHGVPLLRLLPLVGGAGGEARVVLEEAAHIGGAVVAREGAEESCSCRQKERRV